MTKKNGYNRSKRCFCNGGEKRQKIGNWYGGATFFQVALDKPEEALKNALLIKALIKKIEPKDANKKISTIDVRMAIGIGEKTYSGKRVSESNGPAFIYSGEKFETLKKTKI